MASLAGAEMDRTRNEVFKRPPGLTPVLVMLLGRAVREIVVAVGVVGAHRADGADRHRCSCSNLDLLVRRVLDLLFVDFLGG